MQFLALRVRPSAFKSYVLEGGIEFRFRRGQNSPEIPYYELLILLNGTVIIGYCDTVGEWQ